jgi:Cell division protein FtsI/penicillin-binding protein 2
MSFGYGLNVTALQLARAYAVIGSGGLKKPVSFVKLAGAPPGEQVLSEELSQQLCAMLAQVVESGSGRLAKVPGYSIGGKTGTTRKLSSGRYTTQYMALFAGLAPIKQPRFAIVAVVDEPQGVYYGAKVAAPLFAEVAKAALRLFNVPPDDVVVKQGIR